MIHSRHFEQEIVRPTLAKLAEFNPKIYTDAAVKLMMGTAAVESDLGYYLRQHPQGPGRGFWQVEPATHSDVWRYLGRHYDLAQLILEMASDKSLNPHPGRDQLIACPRYACAIARIKYWMIPAPIGETIYDLADYWVEYYNAGGKGEADDFIEKYEKYVDAV